MSKIQLFVAACLMSAFSAIALAQPSYDVVIVNGIVKDGTSKRILANVSVSIDGAAIGTVSNDDGEFSLKIPSPLVSGQLKAQQLGYRDYLIPIEKLVGNDVVTIYMIPEATLLKGAIVRSGYPREIVEHAIQSIQHNYSSVNSLSTAFYRETMQKGRRYIGVSEAVMDVFKTPYRFRNSQGERVRILKGRRLVSQNVRDTLSVKILGGPTLPVNLDFVKNGDLLFSERDLDYYEFTMAGNAIVGGRLQFVIGFAPRVEVDYALYEGTLYIDQESLAFTKAVFSLDMSDKGKASDAILRKKPVGLRFNPSELTFVVTYKLEGGVFHLNYVKAQSRFKCDWKRRLFSSDYTITSEMVMVDRMDNPAEGIARKSAFGSNDAFYDKVDEYWDEDYWKDYNIIELTESLENAISKLRKRNASL